MYAAGVKQRPQSSDFFFFKPFKPGHLLGFMILKLENMGKIELTLTVTLLFYPNSMSE